MTRGKYAARAANHRESQLTAELGQLRAQLAEERQQHHTEIQALKTELTTLRGDILGQAKQVANREIEARRAELEQAMYDQGLSFDLINALAVQRDRLIFNACRYLSMREGLGPIDALQCVWTWFTNVDCYALPGGGSNVDWLVLGLPKDGWVAGQLRRQNPHWRKHLLKKDLANGTPYARPLGSIDINDERIHPNYRKMHRRHYERVRYGGGLALVDSDGGVTEIT